MQQRQLIRKATAVALLICCLLLQCAGAAPAAKKGGWSTTKSLQEQLFRATDLLKSLAWSKAKDDDLYNYTLDNKPRKRGNTGFRAAFQKELARREDKKARDKEKETAKTFQKLSKYPGWRRARNRASLSSRLAKSSQGWGLRRGPTLVSGEGGSAGGAATGKRTQLLVSLGSVSATPLPVAPAAEEEFNAVSSALRGAIWNSPGKLRQQSRGAAAAGDGAAAGAAARALEPLLRWSDSGAGQTGASDAEKVRHP